MIRDVPGPPANRDAARQSEPPPPPVGLDKIASLEDVELRTMAEARHRAAASARTMRKIAEMLSQGLDKPDNPRKELIVKLEKPAELPVMPERRELSISDIM